MYGHWKIYINLTLIVICAIIEGVIKWRQGKLLRVLSLYTIRRLIIVMPGNPHPDINTNFIYLPGKVI